MRVDIDVNFRGNIPLEKLERELIREAAEEVKEEAQENAPKRSGELRGSIRIMEINDRSAKVGSDLVYAPVHEFGGTIKPNKGEFMRFQIGGRWVTLRGVTIQESKYLRKAASSVNRRIPEIGDRVMREKIL